MLRLPPLLLVTTALACAKPAPAGVVADSGAPMVVPAKPSAPTPPRPAAIVREEITVVVAGVTEHWRLEWRRPPTPECMDDAWNTCPCNGIEFGEEGELDLVRERDGAPAERLALDALYTNRTAALPRWKKQPDDAKDLAVVPTPEALRTRPLVRVMKLADYDHDGQATEFVLRVGYEACGHAPALLVGLAANHPKLHAFGTAEAPAEPLLLENAAQWEQVKHALPATLTTLGCGDHGSDVERITRITRDAAGLHAATSETRCAR